MLPFRCIKDRQTPAGAGTKRRPEIADHLDQFLGELGARPEANAGSNSQPRSDDHKKRTHPQHTDFLAAEVTAPDPHPHPVSGMKSRVQRARLHLRTALDECCQIALDWRGGVISYEARTEQCGTCQGSSESAGSEPLPALRPSPGQGNGSRSRPQPNLTPLAILGREVDGCIGL